MLGGKHWLAPGLPIEDVILRASFVPGTSRHVTPISRETAALESDVRERAERCFAPASGEERLGIERPPVTSAGLRTVGRLSANIRGPAGLSGKS